MMELPYTTSGVQDFPAIGRIRFDMSCVEQVDGEPMPAFITYPSAGKPTDLVIRNAACAIAAKYSGGHMTDYTATLSNGVATVTRKEKE